MEFVDNGNKYLFGERAGQANIQEARKRVPPSLHPALLGQEEENAKKFIISDEKAGKIFEEGVYLFFSSSRSEAPYWLNRDSLPKAQFDLQPNFAKRLRNPIYVESGLERLTQWLLTLLMDIRLDFKLDVDQKGASAISPIQNPISAIKDRSPWQLMNEIVQTIMGNVSARLVWFGRKQGTRIGIQLGDKRIIPSLEALSAGQATLLSVFGTLVGDADISQYPNP